MPKNLLPGQYRKRYSFREFQPYVTALGRLTLAWNELQGALGELFWTLSNPKPEPGLRIIYNPIYAWSALKSDRSQRDVLKNVIDRSRHFWGDKKAREDSMAG